MNLLQSILNTQNGDAVRQLAQNFGLGEGQTVSAQNRSVSGEHESYFRAGGVAAAMVVLRYFRHER